MKALTLQILEILTKNQARDNPSEKRRRWTMQAWIKAISIPQTPFPTILSEEIIKPTLEKCPKLVISKM